MDAQRRTRRVSEVVALILALGVGFSCSETVDSTEDSNNGSPAITNNSGYTVAPEVRVLALRGPENPQDLSPVFVAIKDGERDWKAMDADRGAELRIDDEYGRYMVASVCDRYGLENGKRVRTMEVRLLAATTGEVPSFALDCGETDARKRVVPLVGNVAGSDDLPVDIWVGDQQFRGTATDGHQLRYAMGVAPGTYDIVARRKGDTKLADNFEIHRDIELKAGHTTWSNFDLSATQEHAAADLNLPGFGTDAFTKASYKYFTDSGTFVTEGRGYPSASSDFLFVVPGEGQRAVGDYMAVEIAASGLSKTKIRAQLVPNDNMRIVVPDVRENIAPSKLLWGEKGMEVTWSKDNWSYVAHDTEDDGLRFFMPVAYVARLDQSTFDHSGKTPTDIIRSWSVAATPLYMTTEETFRTPFLMGLEGWKDEWNPSPHPLTTGYAANLSASVNNKSWDNLPIWTHDTLAAFFERSDAPPIGVTMAEVGGPTDLRWSMRLQPAKLNPPGVCDAELKACLESLPIDRVLGACGSLFDLLYCTNQELTAPVFGADTFVLQLSASIRVYYLLHEQAILASGGRPLDEALAALDAYKVEKVMGFDTTEYYPFNPTQFLVLRHPDPIAVDSARIWYGVYLPNGKLVQIYVVNDPFAR